MRSGVLPDTSCTRDRLVSLPAAHHNENHRGGTWANNFMGQIVVVKNPLLIYPRAVFAP